MCSFWDSLGQFTPVMIQSKLILQQCCKQKLSWDWPYPELLQNSLSKSLDKSNDVNVYEIPSHISQFSEHPSISKFGVGDCF